MQKTNHINYSDPDDQVYCYRIDKVVVLDEKHWSEYCFKCPYLNGSAQGGGVECLYHDGSNRPFVEFDDSTEAWSDAVEQKAKMGLADQDEARELGVDAAEEEAE